MFFTTAGQTRDMAGTVRNGMKFTKRVIRRKKYLPKKMLLFHDRVILGVGQKAFQKHFLAGCQ